MIKITYTPEVWEKKYAELMRIVEEKDAYIKKLENDVAYYKEQYEDILEEYEHPFTWLIRRV